MALFGNSLAQGAEVGGMPSEMWDRLGGRSPVHTPRVDMQPVRVPTINQPGFIGAMGRFIDPTTNNDPLRRNLGILGQHMMAQSSGVLGGLGRAMVGMRQQGQADEQQRMEAERQAANDHMRNRYMEAQIAQMNQPDIPRAPAIVEAWNYRNSLPEAERADFDRFHRPVPYQYTDDGIAAAGRRQDAVSGAAARHRAPTGGGAPQYEYRMGPDGKLQRRRIG